VTVKNFGFGARRKTSQAKAKRVRKDIPFQLSDGPDEPTFHVRGDLNEDALAVISALFIRAESYQDMPAMSGGLFDTLEAVFTADTVKGLLTRIKDQDDPFGFDQLGEVIEWAIEQHSAGRPSTSPRTS